MKKLTIAVIGAGGTIGKEVAKTLEQSGHQIVRIARTMGDFRADIDNKKSLEAVFKAIGQFDAVAIAAGAVASGQLEHLTDEQFELAITSKLMGQVNVVRTALPYISDGGSFTLVSGVLTDEPIAGGVIGTMVNGAIEGFVKASSFELPRGIRINCISPSVLSESIAYHSFFPGFIPVEAWKVAKAYERAIAGVITGRIIKV